MKSPSREKWNLLVIDIIINLANNIFKSLSSRKIMYWLFTSLLLLVALPLSVKNYFDATSTDLFSPGILFLCACIIVGYIIIDILLLLFNHINEYIKDKTIEKEIKSLTKDERLIIQKLLPAGAKSLPLQVDKTTRLLAAKNILVCDGISHSMGLIGYKYYLNAIYYKKITEMIKQDQNLFS